MSERDKAFERYNGDPRGHSIPDKDSFDAGWRAALDAVAADHEASIPTHSDKEPSNG